MALIVAIVKSFFHNKFITFFCYLKKHKCYYLSIEILLFQLYKRNKLRKYFSFQADLSVISFVNKHFYQDCGQQKR